MIKYTILFFFMFTSINLYSAEETKTLYLPENIDTESDKVFVAGEIYKERIEGSPANIAQIKPFVQFSIKRHAYSLKASENIGEAQHDIIKSPFIKIDKKILVDCDESESKRVVISFFKLFKLAQLINFSLSPIFCLPGRSINAIFSKFETDATDDDIHMIILINRISSFISLYQRNKDPLGLELFSKSKFINFIEKIDSKKIIPIDSPYLHAVFAAIREILDILIIDIYLSILKTDIKSERLKSLLKLEAERIMLYFELADTFRDLRVGEWSLGSDEELLEHLNTKRLNDKKHIFYTKEGVLQINLPKELIDYYFTLYNKATNNNQNRLRTTLNDFWADEIEMPITPEIPGIIQGYTRSQMSVKELMKEFGLEDATSSKPKGKAKKKTPAGEKTSSKESAAASADSDDDTTKVPSVNHNDTDSFYTFNRVLATKQIELDSRILNWYRTTQRGANKGITTQGYLDKDTDRNSIFTHEVSLCHGNQESAIARIIFRHQLPYSLIRTIVSYGTIQESSTDAETTVTALVRYTQGASQSTHFLGEITGNIDRNTFKIWHSFLRPIDNMQRFLRTNLSSMNHIKMEPSAEDLDAIEDQQFTILGEQEGWRVDDRFSQIVISKDDSQYVVFKN